jgi:hypothetical protein
MPPYDEKFKKWAVRLFQIGLFLVVFYLLRNPSWQLMEKLWSRDISSGPLNPGLVPVLVHSHADGKFSVGFFPDLSSGAVVVTDVRDQDLAVINTDLRSRIPVKDYQYNYFKVLHRGQGYTDVSLEVPTTGDFWRKSWYRLQSGSVHPQRLIFFSPFFGFLVLILPTTAGVAAVLTLRFLRRWNASYRVHKVHMQAR